jgi:hypothetical protein
MLGGGMQATYLLVISAADYLLLATTRWLGRLEKHKTRTAREASIMVRARCFTLCSLCIGILACTLLGLQVMSVRGGAAPSIRSSVSRAVGHESNT